MPPHHSTAATRVKVAKAAKQREYQQQKQGNSNITKRFNICNISKTATSAAAATETACLSPVN
jgi:hypothetical protein